MAIYCCLGPTNACFECITDASQPVTRRQFNQFIQQQLAFLDQVVHRLARMEATVARINARMDDTLARMEAEFGKTRKMSRNRIHLRPLRPLRKQVSFSSRYAVHLLNPSLNPLC
jgi:hypothetical protein